MKIILSRKGFDSENGGCPSPIIDKKELLSLPIPSDDSQMYSDLLYQDTPYSELISDLNYNSKRQYDRCHLDPDIRDGIRLKSIEGWKPAFGQINSAQTYLMNAGVEPGDLFLFFGWFRCVEKTPAGFRYVTRKKATDFYHYADLHVIYGYMQIGEIITDPNRIAEYQWHPHALKTRISNKTNALYIPTEYLSFMPDRRGYGTLSFREDRVLTMKNHTRAIWNDLEFLKPEHIHPTNGKKIRKNSSAEGIYYSGIWQELVFDQSDAIQSWAYSIIS